MMSRFSAQMLVAWPLKAAFTEGMKCDVTEVYPFCLSPTRAAIAGVWLKFWKEAMKTTAVWDTTTAAEEGQGLVLTSKKATGSKQRSKVATGEQ